MKRKYDGIDLMSLYSKGNNTGWNMFLTDCYDKRDINALARMKYEIQVGMDNLVKQKLNSEDIIIWFLRLDRSLEITAKKIIKLKHPMPTDSGLVKDITIKQAQVKKQRDLELMNFLRQSSF